MNAAIAIFVKTPGYSATKTRLALSLGRGFAEDWHRRAAATVAEVVRASGLAGYWAVAETTAVEAAEWEGMPMLDQGSGGLGARMAGIHSTLVARHGAAILIGADLPQITVDQLRHAAAWLAGAQPRQVLGPAYDGGFWLFGANRTFPIERWESVEYSRADTARQFVAALAGDQPWELLERQTDLDRAEDMPALLQELKALAAPLRAQSRLAAWLQQELEQAA